MVSFKQVPDDKTKLGIECDPKLGDGKVLVAHWACGSEWYAQLLSQRLSEQLSELLRTIRQRAYEDGWKDAKAKRPKCSWFRGWW